MTADDSAAVLIVSVTEKKRDGHDEWIIRDSAGEKHATTNGWEATLALQAKEQGFPVYIGSSAGWSARNLYAIRRADCGPTE